MHLARISYVDITRTNNLLNIWSGQLLFYRCSVIVLCLNKLETVLKCLLHEYNFTLELLTLARYL